MRRYLLCFNILFFFITCLSARDFLFTSESVTEGHPDKLCDQISDAILDEVLSHDKDGRVACEAMVTKGTVFVAGEISTNSYVDIQSIVRKTIADVGYISPSSGICADACAVITSINEQSKDIALGVDVKEDKEQGAGDQGLMFGYACKETKELMPLPISLSHKIVQKLAELRKTKFNWLKPDGKSQVTVKYVDGVPKEITAIVVSAQHNEGILQTEIEKVIKDNVIYPVCKQYMTDDTKIFVNPTGSFVIGGPEGDTGLTGRKIIVDTYGGMSRHGGGCFSGKDPSKVDRSASYMARHIAKNIVAANLADKCEVQLAYCIGVADPVSVLVDTFNTAKIDEQKIEDAVKKVFLLKPAEIISYLDLKRPIYKKTAAYGHFGREDVDFTWEKTNKVDELVKAVK